MNVREQEYFAAICEEHSIQEAAKRLYISQPTLSQFLSRLEKEMDTRLIQRNKGGKLSLTQAGEMYYESCRQVLEIRDRFESRLSTLKTSFSGLSVGSNLTVGTYILSRAFLQLQKKYPDVQFNLSYRNNVDLEKSVLEESCDIALSPYWKKEKGLCYIDLLPVEYILALPQDHPMAKLGASSLTDPVPRVKLSQFADEKLIMVKIKPQVIDYCRANGITLKNKTEMSETFMAQAMVEAGMGVGLYIKIPMKEARESKVRYLKLDPPLNANIGIYYKETGFQRPIVSEYIHILNEVREQKWDSISIQTADSI